MILAIVELVSIKLLKDHVIYPSISIIVEKVGCDIILYKIINRYNNKYTRIFYIVHSLIKINRAIDNIENELGDKYIHRPIIGISTSIAWYFFLFSKQNLIRKGILYFVIKNCVEVILFTIAKKSFSYLVEHFSLSSFIRTLVTNQFNSIIPLQLEIKNSTVANLYLPSKELKISSDTSLEFPLTVEEIDSIAVTIQNSTMLDPFLINDEIEVITIIPERSETDSNNHLLDTISFIVIKGAISRIFVFFIGNTISTRGSIINNFAILTMMFYSNTLLRLISESVDLKIIWNFLKLQIIRIKHFIVFDLGLLEILVIKLPLFLVSLRVIIGEYPVVEWLIDFINEPSSIDWVMIFSNLCNIVDNFMVLAEKSYALVAAEYPVVELFIDFMNEPSSIDWIKILSDSNVVVNNLMMLTDTSYSIVKKEYPVVEWFIDFMNEPSSIDWVMILSNLCNIADNLRVLAEKSYALVAAEYPVVELFIDFMNEPSSIDWIKILSDSNMVVNNSITLTRTTISVLKEEYQDFIPDDLTLIGDIIDSSSFKHMSLITLEAGSLTLFNGFFITRLFDPFFRFYHHSIDDQ